MQMVFLLYLSTKTTYCKKYISGKTLGLKKRDKKEQSPIIRQSDGKNSN